MRLHNVTIETKTTSSISTNFGELDLRLNCFETIGFYSLLAISNVYTEFNLSDLDETFKGYHYTRKKHNYYALDTNGDMFIYKDGMVMSYDGDTVVAPKEAYQIPVIDKHSKQGRVITRKAKDDVENVIGLLSLLNVKAAKQIMANAKIDSIEYMFWDTNHYLRNATSTELLQAQIDVSKKRVIDKIIQQQVLKTPTNYLTINKGVVTNVTDL